MSEHETGKPEEQPLEQEAQTVAPEGEGTTGQPEPPKAESEDGSAPSDGTDAAAKERKNGVQERINKLVRERHERDRELQNLRKEIDELKKTHVKPPTAPKQEDFENYDDFVVAKAKFALEQETQAKAQKDAEEQRQKAAQEAAEKVRQEFATRVADAAKVYEDFEAVAFSDYPLSEAMYETIATHPKGADIAYYLGSNPDEADRITSLSPYQASAELGALAAKLERPTPRKVTQAPDPLKPVTGNEGAEKPLGELSYEEYKARRMRD